MLPGTYDLALYRGDTRSWKFQLWSNIAKTIPVLLEGASAAAEFRDRPGGTSIVSFECTITFPNIVEVALFKAMWDVAPVGGGAWDLEITFPDGSVRTVIAGDVDVTEDVTHSTPGITGFMAGAPLAAVPEVVNRRPVKLGSL